MAGVSWAAAKLAPGRGRQAAMVALAAYCAVQLFAPSDFDTPRLALFDLYQRVHPRRLESAPVVIVAIDDASLAAIGQWPWPRQIEAELIAKILADHPAALGIDLLWSEPDRQSPEEWLKQAGRMPADLSDALRGLPSHDSELSRAIAAGPTVLGIAAAEGRAGAANAGAPDGGTPDAGPLPPTRQLGANRVPATHFLQSFPVSIRDIAKLDGAASGHGVLSVTPDADGVFRRLPLVIGLSGKVAPGLGLEVLRLAAKAPWLDIHTGDRGIVGVGVGPLTVPTQADGTVWVNFTPHDERRFASARDVLADRLAPGFFAERIVLIGETGLGQVDQRMTPLGSMPGTEIHAQLVETILANGLARRPDWAVSAEPVLTLFLALAMIAILPRMRPRWQVLATGLTLAGLTGGGFALWSARRLLVDAATPALGLAVVFAALIGGEFAEADRQRRRLRREVELGRLAAAKADGELEAARRIQMGILPSAASVADDHRFDLEAHMIPARQIGGDLYDFFKIDEDRLFFVIGDVSGKGVPAALFMALGKSLCKSCALRGETDIGAIIARTNTEISRDNPEMLFITLFAGILNVATGELQFCNAGHDPPWLLHPGAPPTAIEAVGGPPLCVMDDFPYQTESRWLRPGDLLCLMTDGVTEAMTRSGALMGKDRVAALLAGVVVDSDAASITERLHAGVDQFVSGAEPSDDLTILTVHWRGPSGQ